jgi:hypothetical protein
LDEQTLLVECADMLEADGHNGNAEALRDLATTLGKEGKTKPEQRTIGEKLNTHQGGTMKVKVIYTYVCETEVPDGLGVFPEEGTPEGMQKLHDNVVAYLNEDDTRWPRIESAVRAKEEVYVYRKAKLEKVRVTGTIKA